MKVALLTLLPLFWVVKGRFITPWLPISPWPISPAASLVMDILVLKSLERLAAWLSEWYRDPWMSLGFRSALTLPVLRAVWILSRSLSCWICWPVSKDMGLPACSWNDLVFLMRSQTRSSLRRLLVSWCCHLNYIICSLFITSFCFCWLFLSLNSILNSSLLLSIRSSTLMAALSHTFCAS